MTTKLDIVKKRMEKIQSIITGDVQLSNLTKFLEIQYRYLKRISKEAEKLLMQPFKLHNI